MRAVWVLPAGICLLVVVVLMGGRFVSGEGATEEGRSKVGDGASRITLDDGRHVELAYAAQGLVERHQITKGGHWSKPRTIYRSKEHNCQTVTLATYKDAVAAIADYAPGCPESPPDYSIAAVAKADDLDDWDVDVTEHFDGWKRVRFSSSGSHVQFSYTTLEGTATLSWWPVWGFTGTTSNLAKESAHGTARWTADLIDTRGGPGAGWAVALENPFMPPPSKVTLPLAGFALGQGALTLGSVLLWTTLGSLVRAGILYWIGMLFGRDRLHAIWAKLPLVKPRHLKRLEGWFTRNRGKAVFLGHIVPVCRTLVSLPAGVERMPLRTFLTMATLGSLIWNSALVLAGYQLGENWPVAEGYVGILTTIFLIVVGITVAMHMIGRLYRRNRTQRRAR